MDFIHLNRLLEKKPFALAKDEKQPLFHEAIKEVTEHHYRNCLPYKNLCEKRNFDIDRIWQLVDLPYLPTSLFKNTLLLSVPEDMVFREIHSSATTSGRPSRIGLDKDTSRRQSKCFNKVVLDRLGNERRNFIVLDIPDSVTRTTIVSARSSTIRSLLFCANEVYTCLNESDGALTLDETRLDEILQKAENERAKIIIFGFTYILYTKVVLPYLSKKNYFNLSGSKIVHIGGWKKLEDQKVSPEKLVSDCCSVFGVNNQDVIDFYGFTEQSGLIYPTCEGGVRHVPNWCEIIIRDPLSLKPMPLNTEGLVQFISPITTSYPGHSILTEDMGIHLGTDNCPCGRKGATFQIIGRAQNAEVRGCGDIMADKFA